ncbi:ABC transporter ATP-binding protein [Haloglycomyces albus]|uniref:ABC transporter ATP-binding protein n=1 Tax=Haloglycomyces albus TaxID=526067 RepID=UPI00046D2ED1|nr:ABC transporter ATP-binding protein [Haloglycomyces albus]
MAVLSMRNVSRTHGSGAAAVTALIDVDLTVQAGELVAVMGPSGSGKSTLLNLAGGLDQPSSGDVHVEESDLATLNKTKLAIVRRNRVGFVFQDYNLVPSLTLVENVALPLELDGVKVLRARQEAMRALTEMGAHEHADKFPEEISGGQAQRAAIARALIGPRRLILADEPTGALDSAAGMDVLDVIKSRCERGASGIVVTHDARAAAWADRILFLRDGRIVDSSEPLSSVDSLLEETGL